jgi:hypothetical protein
MKTVDCAAAAEIRTALDRYVTAVNQADDQILRDLWAKPERISYANPMQRLRQQGATPRGNGVAWDHLQCSSGAQSGNVRG